MAAAYLRLAFADLGRRRLAAALTVLVVAAATTTLTLALSIGRVAERPWDRTFAATNGAHVTVTALAPGVDLEQLARLPGVVGTSGVQRMAIAALPLEDGRYGVRLVATEREPAAVARPLLVDGSWARPGAVVVERSFARYHGIAVGDTLTVGSTEVEVAGVAVTTQVQRYPRTQPGVAFALDETIARAVPGGANGAEIGLRIADEADTARVAAAAAALFPPDAVGVEDWRAQRAEAIESARTSRLVLFTFSVLMLIAATAVLATLVGGRVIAQFRQLGLLKAIGFTPAQVTGVLVLEQLLLALIGAVAGVALAAATTPAFVAASAALLDAPDSAALAWPLVAGVLVTVLATVAVFTALAGWRGTRRAVVSLTSARGPARSSRTAAVAQRLRLPQPYVLGARDSFARPGRAALTVLSLALTVAAVVATVAMEASLSVESAASVTAPPPGLPPLEWDVVAVTGDAGQLRPVVYGLDAALLALGLANLLATLLLGLRERSRDLGVLKTIGLTPRQVVTALVAANALLAAAAVVVGIPLGLALFRAVLEADGSSESLAYPSLPALALLLPATVAAVALVTALAGRRAAAHSVAAALRAE